MTNLIDHGYGRRRIDVHDNSLVETPPANPRNLQSQIQNQEVIPIFSPTTNNHPRIEEVLVERIEQDPIVNEELVLKPEIQKNRSSNERVFFVNDTAQKIFSLIIREIFVDTIGSSMCLSFWMGTSCFKVTTELMHGVAVFIKEKVSAIYAKMRIAFSAQGREKIGKFLGSTIGKGIRHTLAMTGSASLGFLVGSRYPGATIAFSVGSLIFSEEDRLLSGLAGLSFLIGSYYPVTTIALSAGSILALMKIKNFTKSENKWFPFLIRLNRFYITATVLSHIPPIGITTAVSAALGAMQGMWLVCREQKNFLYFKQSLQYQTLQWDMSMFSRVIDTGFLIPLLGPTLLVYHPENISLLMSMGEAFHNFQPPEGNSYDPAVIVNKVIEAIRQEQKRVAINRHDRHLIGRISKSTVYTFVNSLNEYAQCIQHPDIQARINALLNCPVTEAREREILQSLLIKQLTRQLSNIFTRKPMQGIQRLIQGTIREVISGKVKQARDGETQFIGFELSNLLQTEDLLIAHALCFGSFFLWRLSSIVGISHSLTNAGIQEFYNNLSRGLFSLYEGHSFVKTIKNRVEALLPIMLQYNKQGAFVTHEIALLISKQVSENELFKWLFDVEDFMKNFWPKIKAIVKGKIINSIPSRSTAIRVVARGTLTVADLTVQTTTFLMAEGISRGLGDQLRSITPYSRQWFAFNITSLTLLIIKQTFLRPR